MVLLVLLGNCVSLGETLFLLYMLSVACRTYISSTIDDMFLLAIERGFRCTNLCFVWIPYAEAIMV